MDQFDITLCDIWLYEKKYLVQRLRLHFGDFATSGQDAQAWFPRFYAAAGAMIPWLIAEGNPKDAT